MDVIAPLLAKYKAIPEERFFRELFANDEYKPICDRHLQTVIDVGACAGEFAAYVYPYADTIYSLEPYSEHFNELQANVTEFHLTKIKPHRLALSNSNGMLRLTTTQARGGNFITPDIRNTELVPVKTLARFMQDEGIDHVDVLKIDIEGGEQVVFASPDFPSVAPRIDRIIGEHLSGGEQALFASLGFQRTVLAGNPNTLYERNSITNS